MKKLITLLTFSLMMPACADIIENLASLTWSDADLYAPLNDSEAEALLVSFSGQANSDDHFITVNLNLHAIQDISDRREYVKRRVHHKAGDEYADASGGVTDAPVVEAVPKGFWTKMSEHIGRNKRSYGIGSLAAVAVGIGYNTDWFGFDDDEGSRPVTQNEKPSFSIEAKGNVEANCISSANVRAGGNVKISNSSCGEE